MLYLIVSFFLLAVVARRGRRAGFSGRRVWTCALLSWAAGLLASAAASLAALFGTMFGLVFLLSADDWLPALMLVVGSTAVAGLAAGLLVQWGLSRLLLRGGSGYQASIVGRLEDRQPAGAVTRSQVRTW